jgi:hypothetical protein
MDISGILLELLWLLADTKISTFEKQYTIAFSLPIFDKIIKHLVISQEGTTTLHSPTRIIIITKWSCHNANFLEAEKINKTSVTLKNTIHKHKIVGQVVIT